MSTGKVLIILSDADKFAIRKQDGGSVSQEDTGVFLTELATPLGQLLDAGYEVVFASPAGKSPSVDPLSESLLVYFGNWWTKRKDQELIKRMEIENNIRNPRPYGSISDEELQSSAGVFIPGGHAPITDLGENPELGRILLHFHNEHKATAIICHGPYALLSTKYAPNSPGFAYRGYKLTSWSDAEEKLVEILKGGKVSNKVESSLAAEGADMISTAGKKMGGITVDREVVSGANPMAATALGNKFIELLKAH
ncbi:ThiJ/PfpI family protein [Trametes versicolor FP-101664 SS1]|uniref:ThiJ/PfpI family protein n=1 Tax=Trametes versicolor (strain FP-101664) TaxID=717944 RepID=UPI0004621643|nr:ThiJ/PfpI family protein [Trametes versicolor FP-101664 SS1]EIW60745.1 ThiJ/PfpI family protein [Trametes versicolor FP-101664 SS1]